MVPRAAGARSSPPGDDEERAATAADERLLRRSLGPTAWAVLADLCLDAQTDDDGLVVVRTSARRVAEHLGIGKDTAARALLRLSAAGLTRRRTQEIDGRGRFAPIAYELKSVPGISVAPRPANADTVERSCLEDRDTQSHSSSVSGPPATVVSTPTRRRRATRTATRINAAEADQLCLLDPRTIGVDSSWKEPSS